MIKKEKILVLAKNNNGYITTKEVKAAKINSAELTKLVKEKKIERITRGYYCLPEYFVDDFYKYQIKSKNCIFSHETALYFYDLTDRTPNVFDITVPRGYNGSLSTDKKINLHYTKKENLLLGLSSVKSAQNMNIKVYDIERTICDIIKNKKNMDIEIFTKALQRYSKLNSKDLSKLMFYAKKLKIEKKVREYMEVLL